MSVEVGSIFLHADFERSPRWAPSWRCPAFLWLIPLLEPAAVHFGPVPDSSHPCSKVLVTLVPLCLQGSSLCGAKRGCRLHTRQQWGLKAKHHFQHLVWTWFKALKVALSFKFSPKFNSADTSQHKKTIPQSTSPSYFPAAKWALC